MLRPQLRATAPAAVPSRIANKKLEMKLMIDTKSHKVLFAEASKDVIDFLVNILRMPVGSILKLLLEDRMVGSIGNLYHSLEGLDEAYLHPNCNRADIVNPSYSRLPSPKTLAPTLPKKEFRYVGEKAGGGSEKGVVTYTIMDDLTITRGDLMSTISSMTLLKTNFKVTDMSALQTKSVELGVEEGLELLMASRKSTTVLTHVFLGKKVG